MGLDSLDKLEVKLTIEDGLDILLPEDSFAGDVITVSNLMVISLLCEVLMTAVNLSKRN